MNFEERRAKLENFVIDDPGAELPYSGKLQQLMIGWDHLYTQRIIREYRRFLILSAQESGEVSPSPAVDQAWHLHILYSENYTAMCRTCLGHYLHHRPSKGGARDRADLGKQYGETMRRYRELFGELAPADIWPAPGTPATVHRTVDIANNLVIPLRYLRLTGYAGLAVTLCIAAAAFIISL